MNSKQREQKYERESLVRLCACRLKGHKILTLYPTKFSEKRIGHIKRHIFEGRISKYRYTDCIQCGSKEFKQRYIRFRSETTITDQADAMRLAFRNFGIGAREASKNLNQLNKAINDCKKI